MRVKNRVKLFRNKLKMVLWYRHLHRVFSRKRNGYSQFDEDVFIAEFFADQDRGVYVDIGCFHPVRFSNTYGLYLKGWHGVNVDLCQASIDLFKLARPRDKNICVALSDQEGRANVYSDAQSEPGMYSCVHTISDSFHGSDVSASGNVVKCTTFDKLVRQYAIGSKIDFLSIDAEGSDYSVLKGIDLDLYGPSLVCVEMYLHDGRVGKDNALMHDYLTQSGYQRIKRLGCSVFYSVKAP